MGTWREPDVQIEELYAVAVVSDLDSGERFYAALLGREPDDRPMDGLIQWRGLAGRAGLQVVLDPERAGQGSVTVVVPDLAAARSHLGERGLSLGDDIQGDFGILAQIDDPDGNRLTLAESPTGIGG